MEVAVVVVPAVPVALAIVERVELAIEAVAGAAVVVPIQKP